ncbi:Competence protein CoiA-like family protein [Bacillus sp. THAF10]|nr:Competence protein CoiA-like family protein [Bacillus sp. THAF10]
MFVARKQDGSFFSLLHVSLRDDIHKLTKGESFYCPACENKLLLKQGNVRRAHFAHQNKECKASTEPESFYHLEGKAKLYEKLQGFPHIEMEYVVPSTNQRADVFVQSQERSYAFEFQCSNLSSSEFMKRTKLYQNASIIPIWIIGKEKLGPTYSAIKLNPFHWQFLQQPNKKSPPFILSFCPKEKQFYYLIPEFCLNSSNTYVHWIKSSTWLEYLPQKPHPTSFKWMAHYLHYKKKWRYQYSFSKQYSLLQRYCYQKLHLPLSLIPAAIGLPVPSFYLMHTPLLEWQAWVYFDNIFTLPAKSTIHLPSVFERIRYRIRNKQIMPRVLPLLHHLSYENAIIEYLDCLVNIGHLEKMDSLTYQKLKAENPMHSLEQAVQEDQILLEKVMKKK